jgi:hypothetical protein
VKSKQCLLCRLEGEGEVVPPVVRVQGVPVKGLHVTRGIKR